MIFHSPEDLGWEADSSIPDVPLIAIDGTHSSGKSSVLTELAVGRSILDVGEAKMWGIQAFAEPVRDELTPVVLVHEAATRVATTWNQPEMLTTGYTASGQYVIEQSADGAISVAGLVACELGKQLNDLRVRPVVVTDRSALSGYSYLTERLPEEDPNWVNLSQVAQETGMLLAAPVSTPRDICELFRAAMQEACDHAYITDHTEVPFEDNGLRLEDTELRERIARSIHKIYRDCLGSNRVSVLAGTAEERAAKVRAKLHQLIAI